MDKNLRRGASEHCRRLIIKGAVVLSLAVIFVGVTCPLSYALDSSAKLKILGGISGAQVRINGEYVGTLPLVHATTVQPGMVDIEVEARGYKLYRQSLHVVPRSRERVHVEMESNRPGPSVVAAAPAAPAASASPVTSSNRSALASSDAHRASVYALLDQSSRINMTTPTTSAPEEPQKQPTTAPTTNKSEEPQKQPTTAPVPQPTQKPSAPSVTTLQPDSQPPAPNRSREPVYDQPQSPKESIHDSSPTVKSAKSSAIVRISGQKNNADKNVDDEKQEDKEDLFDPLLIEVFTGYSYLLLALGTKTVPDSEQIASMSQEEAQQLAKTDISDWVDVTKGGGATVGTAVSMRVDFISFGLRLLYSSFDQADTFVLMGEIAQRIQGEILEFYVGLGFGGGWLYRIPKERITANSGLALRLGLGLNFFLSREWALGIGADAIGLFLGGNGVSPSQVGDFSLTGANHPVGLEVPVTINLSSRL
jgi:hypothetical protein